jgi:hypothetical protein
MIAAEMHRRLAAEGLTWARLLFACPSRLLGKRWAMKIGACLALSVIFAGAVDHRSSVRLRSGGCDAPLPRGSNVAILLYGQARTFNVTHCSIVRNVLAPLIAEKHKVRIFVQGEADADSWWGLLHTGSADAVLYLVQWVEYFWIRSTFGSSQKIRFCLRGTPRPSARGVRV